MRLDLLLRDATQEAVRKAGGGPLLDAGLGQVINGAVRMAGIPAEDLSPEQYRAKLGIADHHVEVMQGALGLFQHLGLYKAPAKHPELPKKNAAKDPEANASEQGERS